MDDAHNPDTNPEWLPKVARRVYACQQCGTEQEVSTNHTGKIYATRCAGRCREISNPNTARERVSPYYGTHVYVREANAIRKTETVPGLGNLLFMENGETWLHPFDGSAPIREA